MSTPDPMSRCPGAAIRITRDDFRELQREGERFTTDTRIPASGYGTARVWCSGVVERMPDETPDNDRQPMPSEIAYYGLCSSCSGMEQRNRATLRARQGGGR